MWEMCFSYSNNQAMEQAAVKGYRVKTARDIPGQTQHKTAGANAKKIPP